LEESSILIKRTDILLLVAALLAGSAVAADAADIVGRGSIGASGGGMLFLSGDDFGDGEARLIGQVVFKYNFSSHMAGVIESGYGWNTYPDAREDLDTLAVVVPTTLGLEYHWRLGETKLWPHLGAGGGLYALGVKDTFRSWARANDGRERLTWTSPGVYGKLGAEVLFDNAVSINFGFLYHQIFSKDTEKFPDKWGNQNTSFGEVRLGVNYYFTLKSASPAPPDEE
jgi:opacity protein-like surface antigen